MPSQEFRIERATFVGLVIERKEALDSEMIAPKYSLVHFLAIVIEFVN